MRRKDIEELVPELHGLIEKCRGRGVARYCGGTRDGDGNPILVGLRHGDDIVLTRECVRCGSLTSEPFSAGVRRTLARMFR